VGEWKPKYVIWENVKNVLSKHMRHNFNRYLEEMQNIGYTSNYAVLNAMDFGLPQDRNRVFTISCLDGSLFNFETLERKPMRNIKEFLQSNNEVDDKYRILTELECWRIQGYSDEDFYNALKANPSIEGKKNSTLYHQSGNSIAVPIFESIFKQIIYTNNLEQIAM
jgi:DNA (cytosine-5)-methyltransferase 1